MKFFTCKSFFNTIGFFFYFNNNKKTTSLETIILNLNYSMVMVQVNDIQSRLSFDHAKLCLAFSNRVILIRITNFFEIYRFFSNLKITPLDFSVQIRKLNYKKR